jgi:hypothetical protein
MLGARSDYGTQGAQKRYPDAPASRTIAVLQQVPTVVQSLSR